MKITKYEHACVVVEDGDCRIVLDPGNCTPDFGRLDGISAVVVTHIHSDHFWTEHLDRIIEHNPGVVVFTTPEAKRTYNKPNVTAVSNGESRSVNSLTLSFTGEKHKAVHPDWPVVQNIGVQIDNIFYYGGDSFTHPRSSVKVLAVPASYAWLSIGEAMDFAASVKPQICFLTHDYPLSVSGKKTARRWVSSMCEKQGITFETLEPGESIEVF